jgi:sugar phosphate isomerase/epimerase
LPVHKRFSVCEHVLRLGDLVKDIEAAVAGGASGLSLNAADFGGVDVVEATRILNQSGLAVSSYIDPALMRLGPRAPDLDAIERAFATAAELGAPSFLFIAGGLDGSTAEGADAHLVESLGRIVERTDGTGVRLMLEPLHPIARDLSYVHTVRHALNVVRQVKGVGIVVDTGASWWERDLISEFAENLDCILAVQITNVRSDEMLNRLYVREQCGVDGAVPVAGLIHAFVAAGYEGWFEHEVLAKGTAEARIDMVREDRIWFESLF